MKTSDKKLYFILAACMMFLVCMFVAASEPDSGKLLLPAMILFGFGLFNAYGITFNGHVSGSVFESRSRRDDEYGLRKIWGVFGYLALLGSFIVLFL